MPSYARGTIIIPVEFIAEHVRDKNLEPNEIIKLAYSIARLRAEIVALPAVVPVRCRKTGFSPLNLTIGIGSLVLGIRDDNLRPVFNEDYCETNAPTWLDVLKLQTGNCVFVRGRSFRGEGTLFQGPHFAVGLIRSCEDLQRLSSLRNLGCRFTTIIDILPVDGLGDTEGGLISGFNIDVNVSGTRRVNTHVVASNPLDLALNSITGQHISAEILEIALDRSSRIRVEAWTEEGLPLIAERTLKEGTKHIILNPGLLDTYVGRTALLFLVLRALYSR